MVADYSYRISGRHVYGVRSVTVRVQLLRTSKSGLKEPYVPPRQTKVHYPEPRPRMRPTNDRLVKVLAVRMRFAC
jgi:hypothetical protein